MIFFLIPVYNEEENIGEVIRKIKTNFDKIEDARHAKIDGVSSVLARRDFQNEDYRILIVNDGSTDSTKNIVEKLSKESPLTLINHDKNYGLGVALRSGINYLKDNIKPEDFIVTMDGDNTHPPELAKLMIDKLNSGYSIVIGSRYCPESREIGLKIHRKIISRMAGLLLKIFFPYSGLNDYTSGFRAYRGELILKYKEIYGNNIITEKGFSATVEILLKLLVLKPELKEVPLQLQYNLKKGKSKIKIVYTVIRYLKLILDLKFSKIKNNF